MHFTIPRILAARKRFPLEFWNKLHTFGQLPDIKFKRLGGHNKTNKQGPNNTRETERERNEWWRCRQTCRREMRKTLAIVPRGSIAGSRAAETPPVHPHEASRTPPTSYRNFWATGPVSTERWHSLSYPRSFFFPPAGWSLAQYKQAGCHSTWSKGVAARWPPAQPA